MAKHIPIEGHPNFRFKVEDSISNGVSLFVSVQEHWLGPIWLTVSPQREVAWRVGDLASAQGRALSKVQEYIDTQEFMASK